MQEGAEEDPDGAASASSTRAPPLAVAGIWGWGEVGERCLVYCRSGHPFYFIFFEFIFCLVGIL
jgi:predicted metal-binding membrane protein